MRWTTMAAATLALAVGLGGCGGATTEGPGAVPASICEQEVAAPVRILEADGVIVSVAIGANKLYAMTEGHGLQAVPGCGGAVEVVDEKASGSVARSSDALYWSGALEKVNGVKKQPLAGGPVVTVASAWNLAAEMMAADGAVVAVVQQDPISKTHKTQVKTLDAAGTITVVYTTTAWIHGIAVSAGKVYLTVADIGADTSQLLAVPAAGGDPVTVASGPGSYGAVAVVGDALFFSSQDLFAPENNNVQTVKIAGGAPTVLAADADGPGPIAVDDDHVYWANALGQVMRAPREGGAATKVMKVNEMPTGLALDEDNLFWPNGNGQVLRMTKPD